MMFPTVRYLIAFALCLSTLPAHPLASGIALDGVDDFISYGVGLNLIPTSEFRSDVSFSWETMPAEGKEWAVFGNRRASGGWPTGLAVFVGRFGGFLWPEVLLSYNANNLGDTLQVTWTVAEGAGALDLSILVLFDNLTAGTTDVSLVVFVEGVSVGESVKTLPNSQIIPSAEPLLIGAQIGALGLQDYFRGRIEGVSLSAIRSRSTQRGAGLRLMSDGFADFGDEDFNTYPIDVSFRLATLPAGPRQLAQVGPLELRYELGAIEARLALADGGESFISRPMVPGDLVAARVAEDFWSLTVGTGATAKAGTLPAPDPGVFTLGAEPGAEVRLLDFSATSGMIFSDGFESGTLNAWSCVETGGSEPCSRF